MTTRILIALAVAAFAGAGCEREEQPLADGYTLLGTVVDAATGAPLAGVAVQVGWDDSTDIHPLTTTDEAGTFRFQPSPNSGPGRELFRLEKPGYTTQDVLARTASELWGHLYALEIRLEPEAAP